MPPVTRAALSSPPLFVIPSAAFAASVESSALGSNTNGILLDASKALAKACVLAYGADSRVVSQCSSTVRRTISVRRLILSSVRPR